jgi:protein-disulfide isomerase
MIAAAAPVSAQFDAKERRSIEDIVREYILNNPEIISEAIGRLRERERVAREQSQRQALATSAARLYKNPLTPENGNPNGDVVVVEFFDYQCGYCKRVFPTFMKILESDRKLRVLWKELPILGPVSRYAARAAMAADKQGKYFEYHVALMELRGRLNEKRVLSTAQSIGIDMKRLARDMAAPEIEKYLDETQALATALGINGTPAFLFGDQLVPGAIDEARMRALIAAARKPKS